MNPILPPGKVPISPPVQPAKKGPLGTLREELQRFAEVIAENGTENGKGPKKVEIVTALEEKFCPAIKAEIEKIKTHDELAKFKEGNEKLLTKLAMDLLPVAIVLLNGRTDEDTCGDVKAILEGALIKFGPPLNKLAEPRDEKSKSKNTYIDLVIVMANEKGL